MDYVGVLFEDCDFDEDYMGRGHPSCLCQGDCLVPFPDHPESLLVGRPALDSSVGSPALGSSVGRPALDSLVGHA